MRCRKAKSSRKTDAIIGYHKDAPPMTTEKLFSAVAATSSSTSPELWSHPTLDLFNFPERVIPPQKALLYSQPSTFGESFEGDDLPRPTSAQDLPPLEQWITSFIASFLEIAAGRRQPAQLHARCHRVIFADLFAFVGCTTDIGRVRKIHITQPLDGICEAVAIVRFGDRIRSICLRTEGVDGRWLCTALELI